MALVDSSITNTGNTGVLVDQVKFTLQGNRINSAGQGSHTIRTGLQNKSVLSNNSVSDSVAGIWTIRAPNFTSSTGAVAAGTYTEKVVFSDNTLFGNTGTSAVVFTIRPTNNTLDERLRDIIVERNWILTGANSVYGMQINAQYITVRNNLFDLSLGTGHAGMVVGRTGIEPGPTGIKVYNNTFYSSSSGGFTMAQVSAGVASSPAGMTVVNNLTYAPSAINPAIFVNFCGAACLSQSNNTTNATTNPLLTNTSTNNWRPQAGSAVGTGAPVPLWSDFFGMPTPSPRDLGAVSH